LEQLGDDGAACEQVHEGEVGQAHEEPAQEDSHEKR
jgi:hypothetical protein